MGNIEKINKIESAIKEVMGQGLIIYGKVEL